MWSKVLAHISHCAPDHGLTEQNTAVHDSGVSTSKHTSTPKEKEQENEEEPDVMALVFKTVGSFVLIRFHRE
jgi:hypothetical protein